MQLKRRPKLKRILRVALWSFVGVGLFVLLLSAMYRNDELKCTGAEIFIDGYNHEMFISEPQVQSMLEKELGKKIKGMTLEKLELRKLENSLQRNAWISKAQMYVDNQQVLHVNIGERMPIARVFTKSGISFYLDSSRVILPLSDNEVADVPVFTNLPDKASGKQSSKDSLLWSQVTNIGKYIKSDSFLLMQIGQIDITLKADFIMYPAIGNHTIIFGKADHYENKLKRLSTFYKKLFGQVGLNKYETIDLRYEKQIVATLRGKAEGRVDSIAAMRTFETLVNRIVDEANDTTLKMPTATDAKPKPEEVVARNMNDVGANDQPAEQETTAPVKQPTKQPVTVTTTRTTNTVPQTPKPKPIQQKINNKQKPVQQAPTKKPDKPKPVVNSNSSNKPKPIQNNTKPKPKPTTDNSKQPKAVMPKTNDY